MSLGYAKYEAPIGPIYVIADELGLRRVELFEEGFACYQEEHPEIEENVSLCSAAIQQLEEYFSGKRKEFQLPLSIDGTNFRKTVWEALLQIPYGEVRSYADVAEMIGNPKAVRAVGQANRANPLPIIVPCHRVIGKSGSLVGYAGSNTHIKDHLLKLESGKAF